MRDQLVVLGLLLAFAVAITAHVATAFGLLRRAPRWRGAIALVAPPLGSYWALREGMPVRAIACLAASLVYVTMRVLFRH